MYICISMVEKIKVYKDILVCSKMTVKKRKVAVKKNYSRIAPPPPQLEVYSADGEEALYISLDIDSVTSLPPSLSRPSP